MSEAKGRVPLGEPDESYEFRSINPGSLPGLVGRPVTMNGQRVGTVAAAEVDEDGVAVTLELGPVRVLRFWQRASLGSMLSIGEAE